MRDTWDRIEAEGSQDHLGSGPWPTACGKRTFFRSPQLMEATLSDHGREWRGLAVSILHAVVWELVPRGWGVSRQCRYVHLLGEVADAVTSRACDLAVLVAPRHDGPRRADRGQPGKNAAQIDILLSEAALRAGVQSVKGNWG